MILGMSGRYGQVPSPAPNGRVPSPAPGDGSNPYGGTTTNNPAGDLNFQGGSGTGGGQGTNPGQPPHHRSIHSSLSTIPEVPAGMERTMINVIPPSAAGSAVDIPAGGAQDLGNAMLFTYFFCANRIRQCICWIR